MHIKISHVGRALAFIAIAGFVSPADAADDSGWYVSAGLGQVEYADKGTVRFGGESFAAKEKPDSNDPLSSSISLWIGYRLNRYVSLEAGYLSNASDDYFLTNATDENVGTFVFRTQGPMLAVVGSLPLGKWEPYARVGVLYADTKARVLGNSGTVSVNRERGAELITSLGIAYNFTVHWQAKLEAAFVPDAGERTGTGASDVGVATLGFTYRF